VRGSIESEPHSSGLYREKMNGEKREEEKGWFAWGKEA